MIARWMIDQLDPLKGEKLIILATRSGWSGPGTGTYSERKGLEKVPDTFSPFLLPIPMAHR
jgi:hypothetical protein